MSEMHIVHVQSQKKVRVMYVFVGGFDCIYFSFPLRFSLTFSYYLSSVFRNCSSSVLLVFHIIILLRLIVIVFVFHIFFHNERVQLNNNMSNADYLYINKQVQCLIFN